MTMGTTNPRRHAFITRLLPEPAPTLLREAFVLRGNLEDVPLSRTDLLAGVQGAEAIVCTLTDPIDAGVMDSAGSRLRVISTCAVGFDNIDVAAATERRVFVATTPDVLTDATAELTWALILATARRVVEGDRLVKSGFPRVVALHAAGNGVARPDFGRGGWGALARCCQDCQWPVWRWCMFGAAAPTRRERALGAR